jgi:hypothetical protein
MSTTDPDFLAKIIWRNGLSTFKHLRDEMQRSSICNSSRNTCVNSSTHAALKRLFEVVGCPYAVRKERVCLLSESEIGVLWDSHKHSPPLPADIVAKILIEQWNAVRPREEVDLYFETGTWSSLNGLPLDGTDYVAAYLMLTTIMQARFREIEFDPNRWGLIKTYELGIPAAGSYELIDSERIPLTLYAPTGRTSVDLRGRTPERLLSCRLQKIGTYGRSRIQIISPRLPGLPWATFKRREGPLPKQLRW